MMVWDYIALGCILLTVAISVGAAIFGFFYWIINLVGKKLKSKTAMN